MIRLSNGKFCLDYTSVLNLVDHKKREMEEFIEVLVDEKWLVSQTHQTAANSNTAQISLSPRCVQELQAYLKNEYPEYIFDCSICKKLVTMVILLLLSSLGPFYN